MKKCIICNTLNFHLVSKNVRDSKSHKIIQCNVCHHVQLYPILPSKFEKNFYDKNLQYENIKDTGSLSRDYNKMKEDNQRRIQLVSMCAPKHGTILEIGSGHGFFLNSMKKLGFKMTGIEISKTKRKISKKVCSVEVLDIDLTKTIPNIGPFDIIVLFQVLEHISKPFEFLKNCKKLLKPNGKIILEVPNLDDFQLQFNNSYREFYWQMAHVHYFTPKILKKVLCKSGFKSIKLIGCQRYSIENMFNWKLNKTPQLDFPTFNLPKNLNWIDHFYKKNLEKSLKCDTIIAIGKQ